MNNLDLKLDLQNLIKEILIKFDKNEFLEFPRLEVERFHQRNNFLNKIEKKEFVDFQKILGNVLFLEKIKSLGPYQTLDSKLDEALDSHPNIKNEILKFIQIYFESVGQFKFEEEYFEILFEGFEQLVISKNRIIFSPIFRISVDQSISNFRFGRIQIKNMNEYHCKIIKEYYHGKSLSPPGFLFTNNLIIEAIFPADELDVDFLAENEINKFISCCHLYAKGDVTHGVIFRDYHFFNPNQPTIINSEHYIHQKGSILELDSIDRFKRFIDKFNELNFNDENLGFLERAIKNFSDSVSKKSDIDAVISLWMAFESLLSSPDGTSMKLAYRMAFLIGNDEDEYEDIYKFVIESYKTRNDISHGKKNISSEDLDDVQKLEEYIRKVIWNILKICYNYSQNRNVNQNSLDYRKKILEILDNGLLNRNKLEELNQITREDFLI